MPDINELTAKMKAAGHDVRPLKELSLWEIRRAAYKMRVTLAKGTIFDKGLLHTYLPANFVWTRGMRLRAHPYRRCKPMPYRPQPRKQQNGDVPWL